MMDQWLTNQQFTVLINNYSYGFSKISNIVQEMEYDSIQEGGRNWGPLLFRKPKGKQDVLILEKGIKSQAPPQRAKPVEIGTLINGLVIIVGEGEKAHIKYTFDEGIVTKVELDGLDAMGGQILIRKLEIAHSGLCRMRE